MQMIKITRIVLGPGQQLRGRPAGALACSAASSSLGVGREWDIPWLGMRMGTPKSAELHAQRRSQLRNSHPGCRIY